MKQNLSPDEAKALIVYALQHEAFFHTVHVNDLREAKIDAALEKPTRPAYVKVQVDDQIVMALSGPPQKSPYVFLLAAVPTEALERARASSPLVLPGEH